ncbi:MAG: hypothetical protein JWN48_493 [Myxococcaceae bacterium]|nr:hypothetical protein [Myxococcaceae bacterium]
MSGSLSALASPQPSRPPGWLAPAAAAPPLAYYVATASAHGGLYEEGTFVAAARSLGVPHPPGAPITSLMSAFAALLPIGPLSFRVAVTSAVFAALTLALFARALFFSLRGVGVGVRERDATPVGLLALACTWFVAQTPLFFQQATRPAVFAVQFALAFLVIEATVRFELSEPSDDRRTLYLGAFVQGLAFANHHVFGLMLLAVAAPTLGRVFARRGFLGLMSAVAAPIIGFSAWVYVPIRGALHPFINIGEASRLTRTFWVLNADPWWGPGELGEPATLTQLRDGLVGPHPWPSLLLFGLALVGLVLSSRAESQRRFALLWLITLMVPLACVAWILEPKLLHDAWGALVPCALALVALAACGIGLVLQSLSRTVQRGFTGGSLALAAAMLLTLVLNAGARGQSDFDAPDQLDELSRRNLPTRAVVLSREAGTWFRQLGAEAEEQLRADVTLVPLGFLSYPHMVESLSEQAPELNGLLNDASRFGKLELPSLRSVAALRPLLLELDRHVVSASFPSLEQDGLFARLHPPPWRLDPAARARERARFEQLYARLGAGIHEPEVAARLSKIHLAKAIESATLGDREAATMHTTFGLAVAPDDARFLRLRSALRDGRRFDASAIWREEE